MGLGFNEVVVRVTIAIVGGVIVRLLWALWRRYLGKDPAVWILRKAHIHVAHPKRTTEVIRWAVIASLVVFCWLVIWGVPVIASWLGPHEGDPAQPSMHVTEWTFLRSAPERNQPLPAVNLDYVVQDDVAALGKGALFASAGEASVEELNEGFRVLVGEIDVVNVKNFSNLQAGRTIYSSVFMHPPAFLFDSVVDEINKGTRSLYVLFVWKYARASSPGVFYITEGCQVFQGSMDSVHPCPGDHNKTYRHFSPIE